jgi:glucosylceramidase
MESSRLDEDLWFDDQGTLLPSVYSSYAKYFVRFVEAYKDASVPIYAITPQNEPLNIPNDYPGMGMSASEQAAFLRDYLGPAFRDVRLKTKIMIFDHNWDLIDCPIQVLSDPKASAFAAGTAIHCYGGSVTAQSELHERFPNKDILLTECSGGEWQTGKLLQQQVRLVIGATRNWTKSVVLWNLALDQEHKPYLGGCKTCRGIVTIDHSSSPTKVIPNVDFTALAHASNFVAPGALRIDSIASEVSPLKHVAFRNSDGSIVLLALNPSESAITFSIAWQGQYATYTLQPGAVVTFHLSPKSRGA